MIERRGIAIEFKGVEKLIAACARNDSAGVARIKEEEPGLRRELMDEGGKLLAEFAGTGNTEGVGQLLDLGVDVNALTEEGDPYFDVAKNSTALHSAAWRGRPLPPPIDAAFSNGRPIIAIRDQNIASAALSSPAAVGN